MRTTAVLACMFAAVAAPTALASDLGSDLALDRGAPQAPRVACDFVQDPVRCAQQSLDCAIGQILYQQACID